MPSTINASSSGSGGLINTGDSSGQLELQANGTTKLTVSSTGVSITGGIASPLAVTGNSTAGAELRLPEDTDNGSNYVALKAADNIASNVTFTLPSADGTSGQVIQTNGSGTLSFATPASGALVYLSSQTASNSATVSFTGISSTYDIYLITLTLISPATDNVTFRIRTSSNNGSSYDSGASDYGYGFMGFNTIADNSGIDPTAEIITTKFIGNASGESGLSGVLYLYKPSNSSGFFQMNWLFNFINSAASPTVTVGTGSRKASADVDAIQFYMSSGNISSGVFRLYGVANS